MVFGKDRPCLPLPKAGPPSAQHCLTWQPGGDHSKQSQFKGLPLFLSCMLHKWALLLYPDELAVCRWWGFKKGLSYLWGLHDDCVTRIYGCSWKSKWRRHTLGTTERFQMSFGELATLKASSSDGPLNCHTCLASYNLFLLLFLLTLREGIRAARREKELKILFIFPFFYFENGVEFSRIKLTSRPWLRWCLHLRPLACLLCSTPSWSIHLISRLIVSWDTTYNMQHTYNSHHFLLSHSAWRRQPPPSLPVLFFCRDVKFDTVVAASLYLSPPSCSTEGVLSREEGAKLSWTDLGISTLFMKFRHF